MPPAQFLRQWTKYSGTSCAPWGSLMKMHYCGLTEHLFVLAGTLPCWVWFTALFWGWVPRTSENGFDQLDCPGTSAELVLSPPSTTSSCMTTWMAATVSCYDALLLVFRGFTTSFPNMSWTVLPCLCFRANSKKRSSWSSKGEMTIGGMSSAQGESEALVQRDKFFNPTCQVFSPT